MKIWSWFLVMVLTGCAGPQIQKEVFKESYTSHAQEFSVPSDQLYQAVIKTMCSRSFMLEQDQKENGFILAKRSFQKGKRTYVLVVQAKIVAEDNGKTLLYLDALQTTERYFVADRTRFLLFIIPLPGGGGKEGCTIKEGEKIIEDKEFYSRFFLDIAQQLKCEGGANELKKN